jgi:hypothetical protein
MKGARFRIIRYLLTGKIAAFFLAGDEQYNLLISRFIGSFPIIC